MLASIAQVKGLEFEHVVIPYLERGVFPAQQTHPGEEQNTLYVAMTRARSQLSLLAHRSRPGSFVAQLGYVVSPVLGQTGALLKDGEVPRSEAPEPGRLQHPQP